MFYMYCIIVILYVPGHVVRVNKISIYLERLRKTMVDFIVLSIQLVFMVLGVSYSRVLAHFQMHLLCDRQVL